MTTFVRPFNALREPRAPRSLFGELFGYNVSRTETGYEVELPVPGFGPEQIELTLKDDTLTITGTNEKRTFSRTLVITDEIDPDAISARVEHGLLTIALNRRAEAQPRKITVTSGAVPSNN